MTYFVVGCLYPGSRLHPFRLIPSHDHISVPHLPFAARVGDASGVTFVGDAVAPTGDAALANVAAIAGTGSVAELVARRRLLHFSSLDL